MATSEDWLVAMNDPYMQQIIDGTKNYEFRKYNMSGIKRMWFYRTAPHSAITHVCEVSAAATRNPGDAPLPENGEGNKEFNDKHPDWNGYEFAYRINSVYQINAPGGITLQQMRAEHGMRSAPRGRVMLPASISEQHPWDQQTKVL
ncbi:hypothetical protein CkaCkLH20_10362 [Colletotrichum karsti]|uniref:ASCH domain-containing protein n=1 Tax=Colletotrichum karsti TaxID=1095194 RepID=A0A9P6LGX1_9PEZI|nr:uncharacterized protein CkaCkLH20_10362 [Colletotrichum karsti]KAF9872025.1 hypothetical protein CkaCkLH20_10362 [Colletotrichum karsti]